MAEYDFDLITIGAGSGGVRASRMAAAKGARVAVVENLRTGGTCVMRGCVPKKLLVIGSHFADDLEDAGGYGWNAPKMGHDWGKMIANKNAELDRLEGIYHNLLINAGVTELFGTGVITDAHTVEVNGQSYTAETILVATGGWPSLIQVPGIEHVITSNEALDLEKRPERIVIVGGGYIAVEFAGIFNGFGAQVDIVIRADKILRGFDEDMRDTLQQEISKKGITVNHGVNVSSIEKTGATFTVHLDNGETLVADQVMYATGRAPNSKNIGLENVGVDLDKDSAIIVDDTFKTSIDSIYALGDVTNRFNLTPVALAEAMVLVDNLFGGMERTMDYNHVPSAVFSQPPLASVGLSEHQARERGPVRIFKSRFRPMKYTLSGRDEQTLMKLVVDADTDRVLGCHMVGLDAPEIVQGLAIALKAGATKAIFDATVGIHPTAAEEFVTMREPVS